MSLKSKIDYVFTKVTQFIAHLLAKRENHVCCSFRSVEVQSGKPTEKNAKAPIFTTHIRSLYRKWQAFSLPSMIVQISTLQNCLPFWWEMSHLSFWNSSCTFEAPCVTTRCWCTIANISITVVCKCYESSYCEKGAHRSNTGDSLVMPIPFQFSLV